jgi:hypothetical protein
MADRDLPRATNRHTRICLVGRSLNLRPANATRWRPSPTNFPRADRRSAVAAVAVNRRAKSSVQSSGKKRANSAQTRG